MNRRRPTQTATTVELGDLKPDPKNARQHNARNLAVIEESLRSVGAARSIVIDEEGVILAGNGVVQAAGKAGITRLRTVEADGTEIIAVRRRGLTQAQKIELALSDNRSAELADWDGRLLRELLKQADEQAGGRMGFTPEELEGLDTAPTTIVDLELKSPPRMAWALIGIPIERFGIVQELLDRLPQDAVVNTAANEDQDQDRSS